jgi:hypothetical protein
MASSFQKTSVRDIEELDELLSEPTEAVIRTLAALDGDIVILGVGGKMGPTLAHGEKSIGRRGSFAACDRCLPLLILRVGVAVANVGCGNAAL